MVWVLRIILGAAVLAYAAWLSLPLIDALQAGQSVGQVWAGLAPSGSSQAMAVATAFLLTVLLYGLGGLATATGLTVAPGLFFLGFGGDIVLRLLVAGGMAEPVPTVMDIAARSDAALRPLGLMVETTPLALAALLALGLCILATGVWRGQKGAALTRVWTEQTVWA